MAEYIYPTGQPVKSCWCARVVELSPNGHPVFGSFCQRTRGVPEGVVSFNLPSEGLYVIHDATSDRKWLIHLNGRQICRPIKEMEIDTIRDIIDMLISRGIITAEERKIAKQKKAEWKAKKKESEGPKFGDQGIKGRRTS